jgi:hypothetical protein
VSDPESVMSQFALTAQEKKAVTTTFAHLGTGTSGSNNLAAVIQPMDNWT